MIRATLDLSQIPSLQFGSSEQLVVATAVYVCEKCEALAVII